MIRQPTKSLAHLYETDETAWLLESGTLRNHALANLTVAYADAVVDTGLSAQTFPADCPWTLQQLLPPEVLGD